MEEEKQVSFITEQIKGVSAIAKEYTPEQIKFIKDIIGGSSLSNSELWQFLALANHLKLNPILGEIIVVAYGQGDNRKVSHIITRNGKRVVATRTGELQSISNESIYIKEEKRVLPWEGGVLWGATSTVTRKGYDPITVTVSFKEYDQRRNLWITKPETMIKKVAESQALSCAFPEILGATPDDSEIDIVPETKESKRKDVLSALPPKAKVDSPAKPKQTDEEIDAEVDAINTPAPQPQLTLSEANDKVIERIEKEKDDIAEEQDDIQENTDSMEEKAESLDDQVAAIKEREKAAVELNKPKETVCDASEPIGDEGSALGNLLNMRGE